MRTQVCIIGGGPSGLLLSHLLHRAGIDSVVLERRDRAYVLSRIRAGVLEWGSVEVLREAGVGARMDREGFPHDGVFLSAQNRGFRVDFRKLTGKRVMIYGQTEITHDLYDARDAMGGTIIEEAEDVAPDVAGAFVSYRQDGAEQRVDCDWIVGCDGYHGVSRRTIPADVLRAYERVYPFGWLGVLSETPPVSHELIYANHERGFALCSMRNDHLSRYYVQVPLDEPVEKWSDDAFWDELRRRIPHDAAETLVTGPTIEKSIAPLRSFVAEPLRWNRLFLVGDAAHIVPPTGAKGLNLAIGDVHYLSRALIDHYQGDDRGIDGYSDRALARVWQAIRFSWWFTMTMHRFPEQSAFDQKIQESDIAYLESSDTARRGMAEQYVGVPVLKIADLNGLRVHYRDEGDDEGAAVVFANSLGTDLRLWDEIVPRLPRGLRIVRYDKRGHGLSDCPPGPYAMDQLVDDAAALLDHLSLREVMFVGLSIGGMIAQALAAKRPGLIRTMVISNTAARIGTPEMWRERIDAVRSGGIEALADGIMERWFSPAFRESGELAAWRNMLVRQPAVGYTACSAAIAGADLTEGTRALTLPTLAIAGSTDGSTPPDLVKATADLIPGSAYRLIEGAGHLPCVEKPAQYAEILTEFLQETGHV